MMENKKMFRELNTVRKKVLLLSKLTGGTIVIFYLITSELPPLPLPCTLKLDREVT